MDFYEEEPTQVELNPNPALRTEEQEQSDSEGPAVKKYRTSAQVA